MQTLNLDADLVSFGSRGQASTRGDFFVHHGPWAVPRAPVSQIEVRRQGRADLDGIHRAADGSDVRLRARRPDHAVQELDKSTQQNAAMVEETATVASPLRDQAQGLAVEVARFKLP